MRSETPTQLTTPFALHLDQDTLAAVDRYRTARTAHLAYGVDDSDTSAELFVAYQWAAFDLATALEGLLSKNKR